MGFRLGDVEFDLPAEHPRDIMAGPSGTDLVKMGRRMEAASDREISPEDC